MPVASNSDASTSTQINKKYRLVQADTECDEDEEIMFPSVEEGEASDVALCAGYVAEEQATTGECSDIFYTGGEGGGCVCLKVGSFCARDESEDGHDLYHMCAEGETCYEEAKTPPPKDQR